MVHCVSKAPPRASDTQWHTWSVPNLHWRGVAKYSREMRQDHRTNAAPIQFFLHFEYLADGSNICKTSRCISVADEISQFMDPLVDPCIDFNRFSCGGFERSQTLVGPNDIKQTLDITIRNLKQRIKNLLEIKKNRRKDFETDQKIRDFYDACLKYQSILDREKL